MHMDRANLSFLMVFTLALGTEACVPGNESERPCGAPSTAVVSAESHKPLIAAKVIQKEWATAFRAGPEARTHEDPVTGVRLSYPSAWTVTPDEYLFETYGFVLRGEDEDPSDAHGPLPIARIALDYGATPGDLEARIRAKREEYPDVPMRRWRVSVGGRPAVALGPVPGGQVSTNVYFADGGEVYRINYFAEAIDERGQALLDAIEIVPPTRAVESLNLPKVELLDRSVVRDFDRLVGRAEKSLEAEERADHCDEESSAAEASAEMRIAEGCWTQPSWFFIQTTHSKDANGSGWSQMGTPNFWGDNTHGNWGLGRCVSTYYTNDLYAIDYYLNAGDRLISPFKSGVVKYAGWDPENWWNYGKMVVIADPSGKYWSLSAHMSRINVQAGDLVDDDTIIGWAGSTGYAAPYPHVHQVFYRWPSSSWGRPYGGQGLKQTALHFVGNGGGTYVNFWQGKWASW
jgi:hypothetical protein